MPANITSKNTEISDDFSNAQWLRYCRLTVSTESVEGKNEEMIEAIDLSEFRIRFIVDQACVGKPTTAEITVYNLAQQTIDLIPGPTNQEIRNKNILVTLEAGYESNHAIVFQGELWWKTVGQENETDTYLTLVCASGSRNQNYAVVSASIKKGATQQDILNVVAKTMSEKGVAMTGQPTLMATKLPRGKVIYKMAKDAMQGIADTNNFDWYIGTNGLVPVPRDPSYDPNTQAIVLNVQTGMLGRPKMTTLGVNVECLLNPLIDVGSIIQIDNSRINRESYDTSYGAVQENFHRTETYDGADGFYRVIARQHVGDTYCQDWLTSMICVAVVGTTPITPGVNSFFPNT
ncbi:MAG TPA: hypothetical protein IAC66_07575 [Candidatus Aphodousia gallistercoris]|nr:hypothetical protein [Candidatus Aphodousia gallistercoris]